MGPVLLRNWQDSDLAGYAAMNGDPEVMKYFPRLLTHEESEASMNRQRGLINQQGWGLWAVEVAGSFAGFAGLAVPKFEAPLTAAGAPRFTVFNRLKISARTSIALPALIGMRRTTEKSISRYDGPRTGLREAFPIVNASGVEKAAVLNQCAGVR